MINIINKQLYLFGGLILLHCLHAHIRTVQIIENTSFGFCSDLLIQVNQTNICSPCVISTLDAFSRPLDQMYTTDHWAIVNITPVKPFFINTHDPKTQDIYISATAHENKTPWDKYIWDLIISVTHEPSIIIDVGANIGYFSLMAASLGHKVISIEPMTRNAYKLHSSIIKNHFENDIVLYQNAVASYGNLQVTLKETHHTNQGNGHMSLSNLKEGIYGIDYVNTITIDDVLKEYNKVLLMKIDVEGLESAVLDGAKHIITTGCVKFIVMEFSPETRTNQLCNARHMIDTMISHGYTPSDVIFGSKILNATDMDSWPPNILFTYT